MMKSNQPRQAKRHKQVARKKGKQSKQEELPPDDNEALNIRRQQFMEEPIGQSVTGRKGSPLKRTTRKEGLNTSRMFLFMGVIIVYFLTQMLIQIIHEAEAGIIVGFLIFIVGFGFAFVRSPLQEIVEIMTSVPQKPHIFPKGLRFVKTHLPFWQKFVMFIFVYLPRKDLGSWLPRNQTAVELAREPLYRSQPVQLHVEHQTSQAMTVEQLTIQLLGWDEWQVLGAGGEGYNYKEKQFYEQTLFERNDFVIEAGALWQQRLEMMIPRDAKPTINSPEGLAQRTLWAIRVHIQPRQGQQITKRFPFRVKGKQTTKRKHT